MGDIKTILLDAATAFNPEDGVPSDRLLFPEGMIRLSVGCEKYEELERSITAALKTVRL